VGAAKEVIVGRKTIVFGNGLGMALNADFFSLDSAIGRMWGGAILDHDQKSLICRCLPAGHDRPHGEGDMDTLQVALSACDVLNAVGDDQAGWLTMNGRAFPSAVRQFVYHIARGFHIQAEVLPEGFADALAAFLRASGSHVATLNYDNLVYQPLIDREVLHGYDGALCDGFYTTGFAQENLERRYGRSFGYYLHLHGSPLFVDRREATVKLGQGEPPRQEDAVGSHIVLTHVRHKASVIAASRLLSTYWQYFAQAIQESEEIILLGYSGFDEHLNLLLRYAASLRFA
jgi:hypothetical protein